jgi:hypothetical protein
LIVGGGFAGQPPAGFSCFAGQHIEEGTFLITPRHPVKNQHQQESSPIFQLAEPKKKKEVGQDTVNNL